MTVPRSEASYDVFLSYSDADRDFAGALYRALHGRKVRQRRLKVFFAPNAVGLGESIPKAISDALASSTCLLALVSPDWAASEWTRLESEVAIWRDPAATHRLLLPLLLKPTKLPPFLDRIKRLEFSESAGLDALLPEITSAIKRSVAQHEAARRSKAERQELLAAPILPWVGLGGPSFDFVWPEMIIDPPISPLRHPGGATRLSGWLRSGARDAGCFAVIGVAGSGKTTALRSLMLSGGGDLPVQRIFVHARELPDRMNDLSKRARRASGLALLVDGLDEAGEDLLPTVAGNLRRLTSEHVAIFFAARSDFFERQSDVFERNLGVLPEVLEVKAWSRDDITDFVNRYTQRLNDPSVGARVMDILDSVPGAVQLSSNPMRLTLMLYLLASGAAIDIVRLTEPFALYDMFYQEWITKERHRGTGGADPRLTLQSHTEIARYLYENRGDRPHITDCIDDGAWDRLRSDTAFTELLDLDHRRDGSPAVVRAFRHETIGEYLVARSILDAFVVGGDTIDGALRTTVADDINSYVRSGFGQLSAARVARVRQNLEARYGELLVNDGDSAADNSERLREQILYYLGRLPTDAMPEILLNAFRAESAPLLRRAAALGAILHGDDGVEREYMELLDTSAEAKLNRSVQMVYFGDVHADLHTFEDDGQDWSKTRRAIVRRLAGRSARDLRLRWWDLKTLRSFLESRPGSALSAEEAATVRESLPAAPGDGEREHRMRDEIRRILEP